jgi:hypothetical protein
MTKSIRHKVEISTSEIYVGFAFLSLKSGITKMMLSKEGGFGLQDIYSFNLAMLARQA